MVSQEQYVQRLYEYLQSQAIAIDQLQELTTQWNEHHPDEPEIVQYDLFQQIAALPEVRIIRRDEIEVLTDEPVLVDVLSVTADEYAVVDNPRDLTVTATNGVSGKYDWYHHALTRGQAWDEYGSQIWTTRSGGEDGPGQRQKALTQERPSGWVPATLEVDPLGPQSPYTIEHLFSCDLPAIEAGQPH